MRQRKARSIASPCSLCRCSLNVARVSGFIQVRPKARHFQPKNNPSSSLPSLSPSSPSPMHARRRSRRRGLDRRETRDLLQKLCPSWNICLRAGGKKETNHAVEQELRSAATRAYLALRARETAAPYGAGADGFAHLSGTEATQSIATERVAADGEATERASHCKDHPAVLPTVHGAQSSSAHGKRQAEKHDDLPQNKKSVLHLLQGGSGVCELRRKCVARPRKRCRTEAGRPACCSRAPSSQEAVGL